MGVVVFVDSKNDRETTRPKGYSEIQNDGGNTIPIVLITTADGEKGLEAVSYATLKGDVRKAARNVKKSLADKDVLGTQPAAKDDIVNTDETEQNFSKWTNHKGQTISAMPLEMAGEKVKLRLEDGKTVSYPIKQLSEKSQEQLTAYFEGK